MLSLNKTKSRDELADWLGSNDGVLSWKMDGLTVVLTYSDGRLEKAVTRGNGEVGEVITANAKAFRNVPLSIPFRGSLTLRGEAVIRYSDFERINAAIPDTDAKYKNPRNLCSGSVRQLDSRITAERCVYLYAFALISADGLEEEFTYRHEQLDFLEAQGFNVVERRLVNSANIKDAVEAFAGSIAANDFPSDGLVLIYDDIRYGQSLGRTAKFPRDGIAFKWADETAETVLREVEWSASRTGLINPVAIFDPVELEGTTVSRASLHNISIMDELGLGIGDRITVYKANMIIPQLAENLTRSGQYEMLRSDEKRSNVPAGTIVTDHCPVCGMPTYMHSENGVRTLFCENPDCAAKQVKLFALMAGRDALNIDGLSEATVEKLIGEGLIHSLPDIFRLARYADRIAALEGFGEKSCSKLLAAVEKARSTTLARLLYSLGIPNFGLAGAGLVSRYVSGDAERIPSLTVEELTGIDRIGAVLAASFTDYFADPAHLKVYREMLEECTLISEEPAEGGNALEGLVFVITGSVEHYSNRSELKQFIEARGGKVTGSVTAKTDYLINNDIASGSTKNRTAKELGVEIITEEQFIERFGK